MRHRFGNGSWAVTPLARYGQPSPDYPYQGEAALGKNLTEFQRGVATGDIGRPEAAENLDSVLYTLAESLRIIAILLSPVLPKAAHGIFDQLNWKMDEQGQEGRFTLAEAEWGGLPDGHQLGQPTPLFPRIEVPKEG